MRQRGSGPQQVTRSREPAEEKGRPSFVRNFFRNVSFFSSSFFLPGRRDHPSVSLFFHSFFGPTALPWHPKDRDRLEATEAAAPVRHRASCPGVRSPPRRREWPPEGWASPACGPRPTSFLAGFGHPTRVWATPPQTCCGYLRPDRATMGGPTSPPPPPTPPPLSPPPPPAPSPPRSKRDDRGTSAGWRIRFFYFSFLSVTGVFSSPLRPETQKQPSPTTSPRHAFGGRYGGDDWDALISALPRIVGRHKGRNEKKRQTEGRTTEGRRTNDQKYGEKGRAEGEGGETGREEGDGICYVHPTAGTDRRRKKRLKQRR
jgi:hypothetical protein